MTIRWFIVRRYAAYTILTTGSVTALACFVDFFEKVRHVPVVGLQEILELFGIPLLTRIFGLFPAGMLIGSILLHREMRHSHFYESIALVGGSKRSVFKLFLFSSSLLAVSVVATREAVIAYLGRSSFLTTKPEVSLVIAPLGPNQLGLFKSYNLVTNTAGSTTIFDLDNQGRITQERQGKNSLFCPQNHQLSLFGEEKSEMYTPFFASTLEQLRCYRQLYSVKQLVLFAKNPNQSLENKTFYQTQLALWVKFLVSAMILPAISLAMASGILFSLPLEYGALLAPWIIGLLLDQALLWSWVMGGVVMMFVYGILMLLALGRLRFTGKIG